MSILVTDVLMLLEVLIIIFISGVLLAMSRQDVYASISPEAPC